MHIVKLFSFSHIVDERPRRSGEWKIIEQRKDEDCQ